MNAPAGLTIEQVAAHPHFVRLQAIDGVAQDLRYAGRDNFAGRSLYGSHDCAFLRAEAAEGLMQAARWLAQARPGHRILVLDALRPHRVQQSIWTDVVGTPMALYFADPAVGSIHSHGMAVDVTLLNSQGVEVDMGGAYDEMAPISHPALHDLHLASGALSPAQLAERRWLHEAMLQGGFSGIDTEWWHFDHGDRKRVREHMPRVD
ncbi:MAG: M15 family metallopeptidase [Rubrivivax sp.]